MSTSPARLVFAIYPGMTPLDFVGPYQLISRMPESETLVASLEGGTIEADGLHFAHTLPLADITHCDLLCLPGGPHATRTALDEAFVGHVRRLGLTARYVTSVCTGSLILGAAGLLRGKRAACHWSARELLRTFGALPDEARVVRDGNIITGGGVTAGIDFALTVIAEMRGETLAQMVQLGVEYAPDPPFNAGRPETAPPELLARYQALIAPRAPQRLAEAQEAARRMA